MKKQNLYIFILTILLGVANHCNASDFIKGFEDIPLMKGLTQNQNDSFSFANEETSLIDVNLTAKKNLSFDGIKKFYKESLTQMGWNLKSSTNETLSFYRENNILDIQKIQNSPLKINISLKNRY